MRAARAAITTMLMLAPLCAQTAGPAKVPDPVGTATDWDIAVILRELSAHATRLLRVLDQLHPEQWKEAPETYAVQLKSTKAQTGAVAAELTALAQNPQKLSEALKVYFRMQSVQFMAGSLEAGVRKYQSPQLAQTLVSAVAENGINRDRFQRYVVDLAAEREQEYAIMDHEAQRCRGVLARETPPGAPRKTGKK